MKKFGGVKITLTKVDTSSERCAGCGKTHAECAEWWDRELRITGHAADTGRKSEYYVNVSKIHAAQAAGRDPYCFHAELRAAGYVRHWTPHMPAGTMEVPTELSSHDRSDLFTEVSHGSSHRRNRNQSKRGSRTATARKRR